MMTIARRNYRIRPSVVGIRGVVSTLSNVVSVRRHRQENGAVAIARQMFARVISEIAPDVNYTAEVVADRGSNKKAISPPGD